MTHKVRRIVFWLEVLYFVGFYALAWAAAFSMVFLMLLFLAWLDGGL